MKSIEVPYKHISEFIHRLLSRKDVSQLSKWRFLEIKGHGSYAFSGASVLTKFFLLLVFIDYSERIVICNIASLLSQFTECKLLSTEI